MKRNRKKSALTQRGAYLKNRIARNRGRAQFVGIVYLLSIIALAAAACLPLFDLEKQELAPLGVMEFWKVFTADSFKALNTLEGIVKFSNGILYALMLLVVVINVLRALGKLGWLFKKKASKSYGFNRNVYAMEDLGNIFSGSFGFIITVYFFIAILCGEVNPEMMLYIVLGGGLFIHLFAGVIGGKVSYFDIEDGEIIEDKRVVGRFPAFFRNVLQIAAVGAMMYYFLKTQVVGEVLKPLLEKGGWENYVLAEPLAFIPVALQLLTVICLLPLIKHATATTEYNIDGANGSGMKTFRVFSFFVFLTSVATVVCRNIFGEAVGVAVVEPFLSVEMIIVASIALVMFIIEVIMRNAPGHRKPKNNDDEVEPNYEYVSDKTKVQAHPASPYANAPVYIVLDTKEKKAAVVEKSTEKSTEKKTEKKVAKKVQPVSEVQVEAEVSEEEEDIFADNTTQEEEIQVSYNISCPHCGKALRVKDATNYQRCPACKKVFQLRKASKEA